MTRLLTVALLAALLAAIPAAADTGTAAENERLLNRVQLIVERALAEQRRLEGEAELRFLQQRTDFTRQLAALQAENDRLRQQAGGAPAAAAPPPAGGDVPAAELERQLAAVHDVAAQLAAENARLRAELRRLSRSPATLPPGGDLPRPRPGAGPLTFLDLNTATAEELQQLPGLDAVAAEYIIWYRTTVAPFTDAAELRFVPGVTDERYRRWSAYVYVP